MKRRDFLKLPGLLAASGVASDLLGDRAWAAGESGEQRFWREAAFYRDLGQGRVLCELCPKNCVVVNGQSGFCRVRTNKRGKFYTKVFGRPVSIANDPIEKKPLFHYKPGTNSFSFSTAGCNFSCRFCQNWELSQSSPEQLPSRHGFVSPKQLVSMAKKRGSGTIAFTYGEPVVFYEYMSQIAKLSKAAGIPGVMISNGYIQPEPMKQLLGSLGAVKVDFKAFSDDFYRNVCQGELKPVLETMKLIRKQGVWLEMVHLTVPTLNDDPEDLKRLCGWVLENLGPDVPLHFTRFHPTYKLKNLPPTSPGRLARAWLIAKAAGIHYPYVGNMPGHEGENTNCHHCGELLLERAGFTVVKNKVDGGKCPKCGQVIPGVWK